MAALSETLVRTILLSGRAGPRLLNESAVLLPVWEGYAANPQATLDLLLTPIDSTPAPSLAKDIHAAIGAVAGGEPAHILPLRGTVAVRLDFRSFLRVILPMTGFRLRDQLAELGRLVALDRSAAQSGPIGEDGAATDPSILPAADFLAFAARRTAPGASGSRAGPDLSPDLREALLVALIAAADAIDHDRLIYSGEDLSLLAIDLDARSPIIDLTGLAKGGEGVPDRGRRIWRVSLNREVYPMGMSVETIKADAAQRLFEIDCRTLTWAVIDSGIDGSHPAFRDHDAGDFAIRIDKAYDFSRLRELASYDTLLDDARRAETMARIETTLRLDPESARQFLDRLAEDAREGRFFDWEALSRLIEVAPDRLDGDGDAPPQGHGTHVAGVLAGDWREGDRVVHRGVCPSLRLYDLRVLGRTSGDTEMAVIAALEFVRWVNGRNRYMTIHGVNLSIGLQHDLANYACGQTPVCIASNDTVAAGVCVVVAAGNWGSHAFETASGPFQGYAAISIADPGNADKVITVGATHRERPHEYGISFFSSRGPTGDGRAKPDVVAPGERIDGPLPNLGYGRLDGTSMAAPHVSGVAALLMARHPELIGKPDEVKQRIMDSATDLKRERHFQGAGLVDALRALQGY